MAKTPTSNPAPQVIKKRASTSSDATTNNRGVPFVEQVGNASTAEREELIRNAAYHIAEKDGFKAGREEDYWCQAEKQINGQNRSSSKNSGDLH